MSYTSLLIDTCTTQRYVLDGGTDAYGHPTGTWTNYLIDQACRLTTAKGREIKVGAELVIADYKLFVLDIDITEQHQVIVGGITYEILLVETYADDTTDHHKQAWLRVSR